MPRPHREEMPGGVFHIFNRGNNRRTIFYDDVDRVSYLATIGRVVERTGWNCLSYCLMDNHVHLIVETPEPNLGYGMQRLHGAYVQTFNARHGEDGPLFRGRYKLERIKDDSQLWTAVRYVVMNPVEAKMRRQPEGYAWSSHDAITSGQAPEWLNRERLLELFSGSGGDPLRRYLDFIRATGTGGGATHLAA